MNTNNSQEQNKDLELYLRLRSDIKSAMKNKDQLKLNVVKSILSDLTYVSKKVSQPSSLTTSPPTNQQIYKIINKSVKAHNESIEKFSQAQRLDLVRKEQIELEILESYLPKKKLSEEEIESNIIKFIKDNNLTGNSTNLGKIMKEIKFGDSHDEILVDKKIVITEVAEHLTLRKKRRNSVESIVSAPGTIFAHNESIEKFSQAQRLDLVRKEQIELEILESYLPKKKLSEEEIESNIIKFIKDNNLTGNSTNLGKIMKEIKFGDSHDEILVDKKIVSTIALKVLKNMN
ncbi:19855_t:CDS:2 [Entrophospora sp. SA101]|nr:19855_t:CDS:2 [Entrophospora sp. SA101]